MKVDEIVKLVGESHYFPNWRIVADEGADAEELWALGMVPVTFYISTVDTDRENALAGYPKPAALERQRVLVAGEIGDEFDFDATMFTAITDIEMHERREAYRRGANMDSPFHPHRLSGDKNWKRLTREVSE